MYTATAARRLRALLVSLYFVLLFFTVTFHSHDNGNDAAVHHACDLCILVADGGLADGGGPTAATTPAPAALPDIQELPVLTTRLLPATFLLDHPGRAPPFASRQA